MNADAPFSTNGFHKPVPEAEKKNVPALVIGLIAIPLLLLIVIPVAYTIAMSTGKPVFDVVEELNLEEVSRFEVRLFNLKSLYSSDRKDDDIGPYVAKPEHYERLLAPLKSATVVDELPAKAFLGEYRIHCRCKRRKAEEELISRSAVIISDCRTRLSTVSRSTFEILRPQKTDRL